MKLLLDFIAQHPDEAGGFAFFIFAMVAWAIPAMVIAIRDGE